MKKCVKKEMKKIDSILFKTMKDKKVSFNVVDLSTKHHQSILIEPINYKNSIFGSKLDGMQIIFEDGIYEVSEFQAGKNQNELHIFLETKSFKVALNNMLKVNNRPKSQILKIWS